MHGFVLESNKRISRNQYLPSVAENKPENPFQTMTSQISLIKPIYLNLIPLKSKLSLSLFELIRAYPSVSECIRVHSK